MSASANPEVAPSSNDPLTRFFQGLPKPTQDWITEFAKRNNRLRSELTGVFKGFMEASALANAPMETKLKFAKISVARKVTSDPSMRPLPMYRLYLLYKTDTRVVKVDEKVDGQSTGRKVSRTVRDAGGIAVPVAGTQTPFFGSMTAWGDEQTSALDMVSVGHWYEVGLSPRNDRKAKTVSRAVALAPADHSKWNPIDVPGFNVDKTLESLIPIAKIPELTRHFGQPVRIRAQVTDVSPQTGKSSYIYRISDEAFSELDPKVQAQVGSLVFFANPTEGIGGFGTEVELFALVQRVEKPAMPGYTPVPLEEVQLKTYMVKVVGYSAPLPEFGGSGNEDGVGDEIGTGGGMG
jgi:hypothetical protein